MKKIGSLLFIVAFFTSSVVLAQQLTPQQQQAVNKLFKTKNVVYFNFKVRSMQEVAGFSKMLSVDKTKGAQVFAHANKAQFTQFIRMNYAYTVTSGGGTAKKKTATKTTTTKAKAPVKKK